MDTVRWQTITSSMAELEINYGLKYARLRLENLAIPEEATSDAKAFYLERVNELFAAINDGKTHWMSRPSE